jgi:heme-degrading monooxygenase HmoA
MLGEVEMTVVVLTTISVKEGSIDEVARLFEETNRPLVEAQPEWLGAWFTANRERSQITNIAYWKSAEAYERLRGSEAFKATMGRFAEMFVGPPSVSINELLVEMTP